MHALIQKSKSMGNRSSVNQPCAAGLGFATTLDLLLQDFVTRFVDVCEFRQCYDPLNAPSPVRRLAPLCEPGVPIFSATAAL